VHEEIDQRGCLSSAQALYSLCTAQQQVGGGEKGEHCRAGQNAMQKTGGGGVAQGRPGRSL
jgi:hypothetical protein